MHTKILSRARFGILLTVFLLSLVLGTAASLEHTTIAYADPTYKGVWIDTNHIYVAGTDGSIEDIFTLSSVESNGANSYNVIYSDYQSSCTSKFKPWLILNYNVDNGYKYEDATTANQYSCGTDPSNYSQYTPYNLIQLDTTEGHLRSPNDALGVATWVDKNLTQINYSVPNALGLVFTHDGTPPASGTIMYSSVDGGTTACGHSILEVTDVGGATTATLVTPMFLSNCQKMSQDVTLQPYGTTLPPPPGPPSPPGNNGNGSDGCLIGGPLSWIACPVITLLGDAIGLLSSALENALYIPVDQFFGVSSPVLQPFNTFRNIAVALLVVAGLVMVISEAAGFEVLSPYTIRKALPRIVMATIGIALVWPILKFGITLSNDLGLWMNSLIATAFHTPGTSGGVSGIDNGIQTLVTILIPVGAAAAAADAVIAGAGGIVGSLLLTLLATLFIGYLVLALRQMVILVGIIVAPLAIAASILPGTRKIWDFWEDSMLGALAMFPIIMAFLGAGTALSHVAEVEATAPDVGAGAATTWTLMAVFAIVGALVLVPLSFRIASGILRTAHAALTGSPLSKGFFAKQKEYRGEKRAQQRQKFYEGGRYSGALGQKLPWGKKLNKFGKSMGAFKNTDDKLAYLNPRNKGYRKEAERQWGAIVDMNAAKKPGNMATNYNADMQKVLTYGEEGAARQRAAVDNGWFKENANHNYSYKGANGQSIEVSKSTYNKDTGTYTDAFGNVVTRDKLDRDEGRLNQAINAAYASGGFSFDRQQWAVDQLARNGDYTDMQDAMTTIARASNGNELLRHDHIGTFRSSIDRAGLGHLKAPQTTLQVLVDKVADGHATQADYEDAVVEAVSDKTDMEIASLKNRGVVEATKALANNAKRNFTIASTTTDADTYREASTAAGASTRILNNIEMVVRTHYASANNQASVNATVHDDDYTVVKDALDEAMRLVPAPTTTPQGQPLPPAALTVNAHVTPAGNGQVNTSAAQQGTINVHAAAPGQQPQAVAPAASQVTQMSVAEMNQAISQTPMGAPGSRATSNTTEPLILPHSARPQPSPPQAPQQEQRLHANEYVAKARVYRSKGPVGPVEEEGYIQSMHQTIEPPTGEDNI